MIILGLGTNIGDRLDNLRNVLTRISLLKKVKILKVSPVYESSALLPTEHDKAWDKSFLNAAIGISTELSPIELLAKIKEVERSMGRANDYLKWSPRVIDIDILTWGEEYFTKSELMVPHPELVNRPFALWPAADLEPTLKIFTGSGFESLSDLAGKFGSRFDGQAILSTKQIAHRIDTPIVMGIVNLTSDSFSQDGLDKSTDLAIERALKLVEQGAEVIDVGAESTRPGAKPISAVEEWSRLKPFIERWSILKNEIGINAKISIDTYKASVVEQVLSLCELDYINDVSGLTTKEMRSVVRDSNAKAIFMHNLGVPAAKDQLVPQQLPVLDQVYSWGKLTVAELVAFGISRERLIFDVGIGFGKTAEQSFEILKNIKHFSSLGFPLLVGHSRKSFLDQLTKVVPAERDLETAIFSGYLATSGVSYLRVHNVDYTMRLIKLNKLLYYKD